MVDLSLGALFKLIWKNRKLLIVLTVVSGITAAIVSLFMTEYFSASVIIFPARTNSITLNESGVKRGNISDFGEEQEAEQLLQVINSEDVQERVIAKNDLYNHYEVNIQDKYARTKIRQIYSSRVTAKRTKYNSIDISVKDVDPQIAANIANSISEFTDSVKNRMIRERAQVSMQMINKEFDRINDKLTAVVENLNAYHEMGVLGEMERAALLEAYSEVIRAGDRVTAKKLADQIDLNRKYGDEYDIKRRQRDLLSDQFLRFQQNQNQFKADAAIDIPQKFTVDIAVAADKKSYPIRWLIVMGSIFSVLLLAIILLILKENYLTIFS
jgi:uncharacterized protein involved in exopolysaccharide biosynthesis